ncbi:MAG: SDR family oxidoreductase [Erysipelotrichaceae bacterium]
MSDKVLLVTGATSDIGTALIRKIHENYKYIIAHYNNKNDNFVKLENDLGDKFIAIHANFLDEEETLEFSKKIIDLGMIPTHFIHLPAFPFHFIKFAKTNWNDFEKEFSIGFRSATIICQSLLPLMVKNGGGKIILMLSYNLINQPVMKYVIPYTTSKYAMLGLMKGLASEYANKNITVNGISPSIINTKYIKRMPEVVIEKSAYDSPFGDNLMVSDLLPLIELLFSSGGDRITGQNIAVTGGN